MWLLQSTDDQMNFPSFPTHAANTQPVSEWVDPVVLLSNSNDQLCQPYIMDSGYKGTWVTFFLLCLRDLASPVPMLSGRWLAFLGSINCAHHTLHCRWRVDSCSQNGIMFTSIARVGRDRMLQRPVMALPVYLSKFCLWCQPWKCFWLFEWIRE